jgi:hypothetical protein
MLGCGVSLTGNYHLGSGSSATSDNTRLLDIAGHVPATAFDFKHNVCLLIHPLQYADKGGDFHCSPRK